MTTGRRMLPALATLLGCGGGGPTLVPSSALPQQNVMVIDEGMDLSVPDLQGRVAAAYTETCVQSSGGGGSLVPPGGPVDAGPQFDSLKQMFIAAFAQTDDSCHLRLGISSKPDPLAAVAKYKQRWNQMVRANQVGGQVFATAEWSELTAALDKELQTFAYHGTSTSTTIAHDNPNVRLVLVERELQSESQLQAGFTCFDQAEIDQVVALLNDPDVFAAAARQPATLDTELAAAMASHKVGLVNESFGASSRAALENLQAANCPDQPIDLSAYFTVLSAVDVAHAATLTGPAALTLKAAGNDGALIDSGADALDCVPGDPTTLLVGSYDPANGTQNMFSNHGACVAVYAPGQGIVTTYAGGWLFYVDGTSFASPLTAWFASANAPSPFSVSSARQVVLANVDGAQQLPASLFPADFFYAPSEATADALVALPLRAAAARRQLSWVDLHRVMAPLQRLRALRGG